MDRIAKLKGLLEVNPVDSFIRHALALEYVKLGNDPEARKLFESILNHDPSYIGSYYHLAKLHERNGDEELAINWYQKGMEAATRAGETHAFNELKSAYEELVL